MFRELIKAFLNNFQINRSLTALLLHVQYLYVYRGSPNKTAPHSLWNKMILVRVRERTNMSDRRWNWSPAPPCCLYCTCPLHQHWWQTKNAKNAGIQVTAGWSEDRRSCQADQQHSSCFSILWPKCRYKCKTFRGWCERWKKLFLVLFRIVYNWSIT